MGSSEEIDESDSSDCWSDEVGAEELHPLVNDDTCGRNVFTQNIIQAHGMDFTASQTDFTQSGRIFHNCGPFHAHSHGFSMSEGERFAMLEEMFQNLESDIDRNICSASEEGSDSDS